MKVAQVFILLFVGTAVGCAIWFGFFSDLHFFNRKVASEERHAEQVGAKPLPIEPVKVVIRNSPRSCAQLTSAEFDGDTITVGYEVACSERYMALRWKQRSPNGTLIDNGYTWIWAGSSVDRGEHGNFTASPYSFKFDPRTSVIEVTANSD